MGWAQLAARIAEKLKARPAIDYVRLF
jgi:ubiquitin carboxyl-terminal hydrolase 34